MSMPAAADTAADPPLDRLRVALMVSARSVGVRSRSGWVATTSVSVVTGAADTPVGGVLGTLTNDRGFCREDRPHPFPLARWQWTSEPCPLERVWSVRVSERELNPHAADLLLCA